MDKFIILLPKGRKRSIEDKSKLVKPCEKKLKSTQMFLDLGQKSFGSTKSCKICSMIYLIGDFDDELRHKLFCTKVRVNKLKLLCKFNLNGIRNHFLIIYLT